MIFGGTNVHHSSQQSIHLNTMIIPLIGVAVLYWPHLDRPLDADSKDSNTALTVIEQLHMYI